MAREQISDSDVLYTISPLEAPPAGLRNAAVFSATVSDETTGRAPRAPVNVSLLGPLGMGLSARMSEPGVLAVSGKVQQAFTTLLASTGELDLRVSAPGFIDQDLTITFACAVRTLTAAGAGASLTLDSNANLLAGQRLLISTADGARVEMRAVQSIGPGTHAVTLAEPLDSAYPAGSFAQPLPAGGTVRTLTTAGTGTSLSLDSNVNLLTRQQLLISTADGSRFEFSTVQSIGPGTHAVTLAEPLNSSYPTGSLARPLPAAEWVELHRMPTSISGRILKRSGTLITPAAGIDVRISQLWRRVPPAGATVHPEWPVPTTNPGTTSWPTPLAAIRPPCYADFATTASVVVEDRPVDTTMSAKSLLESVAPGSTLVRLSDALSLATNDVIALDADDDGRREIFDVVAIELSGTSGDWATVTLSQPLALPHRAGCLIRRLGAPLAATPVSLNYDALRGDGALLFDATGITGFHQIRVTEPGPPVVNSYHRLDILATQSDAGGCYRLPPIARAGKVQVFARDPNPPHAQQGIDLVPDYILTDNVLDIVIS